MTDNPGARDAAFCLTAAARRRRVAVSGILFMAVLGTMYAWSVFRNPLRDAYGWTGAQVSAAFSIHLLVNGFACAFLGHLSDILKGRRLAFISASLFGTGFFMGGLAGQFGLVALLWLGYGVIGGLANGLGYLNTLNIMIKHFPEKPALATGAAVMGTGLGAAVIGQAAPILIEVPWIGPGRVFYLLGILFTAVLLLAARRLRHPSEEDTACPHARPAEKPRDPSSLREALSSRRFYLLWLTMFIYVVAGTSLISNLSPMSQLRTGISAITAGTLIFFGSLFNGAGRLFWAWMASRFGRREIFMILFGLMSVLFLALPFITSPLPFAALSCLILLSYGGAFGTMPSLVADNFGIGHFGAIYGKMLLAFGIGGTAGPLMTEKLFAATGSYTQPLALVAALLAVGILMIRACRCPAGPRLRRARGT